MNKLQLFPFRVGGRDENKERQKETTWMVFQTKKVCTISTSLRLTRCIFYSLFSEIFHENVALEQRKVFLARITENLLHSSLMLVSLSPLSSTPFLKTFERIFFILVQPSSTLVQELFKVSQAFLTNICDCKTMLSLIKQKPQHKRLT